MNICICDDNTVFCGELKKKIIALAPNVNISVFKSGDELTEYLSKKEVEYDVFLLDIELKNDVSNGITLAKKLNELCTPAQIIFVTAYPEYVSDVYETEHCYFIKKSDLDAYLPKALEKATSSLYERPLLLNTANGLIRILPSEIVSVERKGRNSEIALLSNERVVVYKSFAEILSELPQNEFACCHYSFIIPLRLIRSLGRNDVALEGGARVPVSRSRYAQVKLLFARYIGGKL